MPKFEQWITIQDFHIEPRHNMLDTHITHFELPGYQVYRGFHFINPDERIKQVRFNYRGTLLTPWMRLKELPLEWLPIRWPIISTGLYLEMETAGEVKQYENLGLVRFQLEFSMETF